MCNSLEVTNIVLKLLKAKGLDMKRSFSSQEITLTNLELAKKYADSQMV